MKHYNSKIYRKNSVRSFVNPSPDKFLSQTKIYLKATFFVTRLPSNLLYFDKLVYLTLTDNSKIARLMVKVRFLPIKVP
jgi:hypothetical protein